jgi:phosphopantothenoylcysteine decarboxylase/phosphopantothenate--cysteine ligase
MKRKADNPVAAGLSGREVLVTVCGGIAAYKVCYVVSELVQRGAGVTVAMTAAATKLIGPVTFAALSARRVLTDMWSSESAAHVQHISVTESADLVLVAPATANMIGKIAAGVADDLVSTMLICAASPVILAPAMNDRMWANQAVQDNVARLTGRGFLLVGPAEGRLACGSAGPGRMAEPDEILEAVTTILKPSKPVEAGQGQNVARGGKHGVRLHRDR